MPYSTTLAPTQSVSSDSNYVHQPTSLLSGEACARVYTTSAKTTDGIIGYYERNSTAFTTMFPNARVKQMTGIAWGRLLDVSSEEVYCFIMSGYPPDAVSFSFGSANFGGNMVASTGHANDAIEPMNPAISFGTGASDGGQIGVAVRFDSVAGYDDKKVWGTNDSQGHDFTTGTDTWEATPPSSPSAPITGGEPFGILDENAAGNRDCETELYQLRIYNYAMPESRIRYLMRNPWAPRTQ
jgi:hypothetical protein